MSLATLPKGIDVSNNNGSINWASVAAQGIKFAFAKASEGSNFIDTYFPGHWAGMKENGIYRGAYHYARPENNPARVEADWFYSRIESAGGLEVGDMIALDFEPLVAAADYGSWTLYFLQILESYYGFPPLLYTGRPFITKYGLDKVSELAKYGLWLADWRASMPTPPAPFQSIAFWQYSASGSINGISGDVDLDRFNGTLARMILYGKPETHTVEPQPPVVEHTTEEMIKLLRSAYDDISLAENNLNTSKAKLLTLEEILKII